MKQTQRHQQILEMLKLKGFASTEDLVAQFEVSPQTIRRDLNDLAEQNSIRRHHGGASLMSSTVNAAYDSRKVMYAREKESIGKAIAAQIPDGASLFIDIGTTTEAVARALLEHNELRVITNNIHVASILSQKEDFTVIIAGGEVRNRDGGIVGEATRDFVQQFRTDFGIIGISGIDTDGSLLEFDYHEVRIAQAIINNSRQVLLAADHSKFGRNAMVNMGNITQVSALFTDQSPPSTVLKLMEANQVACYICS
ncbi:DeoR/GlpR family transcriptional regulator [Zobellella aerophila]|uniref:DeoR/GlpR family transcriptional regulator n=1 Tax=Zobellella aerophila TaxID=870480 RepID=A0ABP6VBP8_9GAMM